MGRREDDSTTVPRTVPVPWATNTPGYRPATAIAIAKSPARTSREDIPALLRVSLGRLRPDGALGYDPCAHSRQFANVCAQAAYRTVVTQPLARASAQV